MFLQMASAPHALNRSNKKNQLNEALWVELCPAYKLNTKF